MNCFDGLVGDAHVIPPEEEVFYTETIESGYPFPFRCVRPRVQVVYIDLDHLHLAPCPNPEVQLSVTRDLVGYQ